MKNDHALFIPIFFSITIVLIISFLLRATIDRVSLESTHAKQELATAMAVIVPPFTYTFNDTGVLEETGDMQETTSPYWWLDSGGRLILENNMGQTIQGDLPPFSPWRIRYMTSNRIDTDNGLHPQNLFRLITRTAWGNFTQEVYFKINKLNMSTSPNRNESNGVFLFEHYLDHNNLYYVGVRVDGNAVIKKKINSTYYTMQMTPLFNAEAAYNRDTNPNLLPGDTWIGIRGEIQDNKDDSVDISFFVDKGDGVWKRVLRAHDDGKTFGGKAITQEGYGGIRSDFMDLYFDNYKIARNEP